MVSHDLDTGKRDRTGDGNEIGIKDTLFRDGYTLAIGEGKNTGTFITHKADGSIFEINIAGVRGRPHKTISSINGDRPDLFAAALKIGNVQSGKGRHAVEIQIHNILVRDGGFAIGLSAVADQEVGVRILQRRSVGMLLGGNHEIKSLVRFRGDDCGILIRCGRTGRESSLKMGGTAIVAHCHSRRFSHYGLVGTHFKEMHVLDVGIPPVGNHEVVLD